MLNENFQSGFYYQTGQMATRMDGTTKDNYVRMYLMYNTVSSCHYGGTGSNGFHVMIGGGDTAPTRDEYDMADASIMANNKMKSLIQSSTWARETGVVITTQWQNASNEPIIVKEVALAEKVTSATYSKAANIMIARKVLSTPITVQPEEVYAFSYGISI